MILETKRLILRNYTYNDFNELKDIITDTETMKHYPKPYDLNGVKRWIDWNINNYKKYGFGLWAIELKETGKFIGDCGITIQNIDGSDLPEIGYHINKKYWQKGFAKEAARAVRDWAFNNLDYDALYSYMNVTNIASYKTASTIGMKRINEYNDGIETLYVYSITKEEWKKHIKMFILLMVQPMQVNQQYVNYYLKNIMEFTVMKTIMMSWQVHLIQ